MEELYNTVLTALQVENKEVAVKASINALKEGKVTVAELYEHILVPALNNIMHEYSDETELIWREHVRSGIIRTIIESAYPYILQERKKIEVDKGRVIVMCPEYEDHELGAKMVSDFFKLAGYDSSFIGARTPFKTIMQAIKVIRPKYITISVTNYYNLISVKKTIQNIKDKTNYPLTFIVGGNAFKANPAAYQEIGADLLLNDFSDIYELASKEGDQ